MSSVPSYTISINGNSNDSDLVLASSNGSIVENTSANLVPLTGRVSTLETKKALYNVLGNCYKDEYTGYIYSFIADDSGNIYLKESIPNTDISTSDTQPRKTIEQWKINIDGTLDNSGVGMKPVNNTPILISYLLQFAELTPPENLLILLTQILNSLPTGYDYFSPWKLESIDYDNIANQLIVLNYSGFYVSNIAGEEVFVKFADFGFPIIPTPAKLYTDQTRTTALETSMNSIETSISFLNYRNPDPDELVFLYGGDNYDVHFADLFTELTNNTGKSIRFLNVIDSPDRKINYFNIGVAHIGAFDGGEANQARIQCDFEPFAIFGDASGEPDSYQSYLITHNESGINSLTDISNLTELIYGGDTNSASGFKYPVKFIKDTFDKDYNIDYNLVASDYDHPNGHARVLFKMLQKNPNDKVAAVASSIYEYFIRVGIDVSSLIILNPNAEKLPRSPWGCASYLNETLKTQIKNTFLTFDFSGTSVGNQWGHDIQYVDASWGLYQKIADMDEYTGVSFEPINNLSNYRNSLIDNQNRIELNNSSIQSLETKTATLETKTTTLETSMNSVQLEVDNLNDKRIAVLYDGTLNNGFNILASQGCSNILTQMVVVSDSYQISDLYDRSMLVGLGFDYGGYLKQFASSKPANTVFAALDYNGFTDATGGGVNVSFKEDEMSFPIGMLCGLKSQSLDVSGSIKVGFIGAVPMPIIQNFENGFKTGVEYIDPSARIDVSYVDTNPYSTTAWNDISTNYNIALSMYNSGINVIYHAAADGGIGVFMAAKKYSEDNSTNVYACGPDQDTYLYNTTGTYENLKPYVLTGSIKHTGNALKYLVKEYINNGFDLESQNISLGFSENALAYAPIRNGLLSTDRIGIVDRTINEIKATSYPLPPRSITLDAAVNSDLSRIYVGEYTLNGSSSSMVFAFSSDFSYCNNLSLANPFAPGISNISDICSNVLIDSHLYSDKTYYNFSPWDKTSVANAKLSLLEISSNSVESRYRYVIDGSDADLPMMYNRSFLDSNGALGLPGFTSDISDVYTVGEIFRTFVHNKINDTISLEGPMYLIRHDLNGNEYEPNNRVTNPEPFVAAQLNRVCVRIQ